MKQILAILVLIALIVVLTAASICRPLLLTDTGNPFLKDFVNQELLAFLGVIVTITLASAANLHLEFNRLESLTKETFVEARRAIKAYAILLLWLFGIAFALVVLKPIVAISPTINAAFNSGAIVIVVLNILSLADLTMAIFRIRPKA